MGQTLLYQAGTCGHLQTVMLHKRMSWKGKSRSLQTFQMVVKSTDPDTGLEQSIVVRPNDVGLGRYCGDPHLFFEAACDRLGYMPELIRRIDFLLYDQDYWKRNAEKIEEYKKTLRA